MVDFPSCHCSAAAPGQVPRRLRQTADRLVWCVGVVEDCQLPLPSG